jgi:hypothetical protein
MTAIGFSLSMGFENGQLIRGLRQPAQTTPLTGMGTDFV